MSLEWARARALENEARRRELVNSTNRQGWAAFTMTSTALMTFWLEAANADQLAPEKDADVSRSSHSMSGQQAHERSRRR
jgi:hypothetical protein